MFEIRTSDSGRLKRIIVAGTGGILVGFLLVGINVLSPLLTAEGYNASNLVFGLFGLVVIVFATHPTYQAASKLDDSAGG